MFYQEFIQQQQRQQKKAGISIKAFVNFFHIVYLNLYKNALCFLQFSNYCTFSLSFCIFFTFCNNYKCTSFCVCVFLPQKQRLHFLVLYTKGGGAVLLYRKKIFCLVISYTEIEEQNIEIEQHSQRQQSQQQVVIVSNSRSRRSSIKLEGISNEYECVVKNVQIFSFFFHRQTNIELFVFVMSSALEQSSNCICIFSTL